MPELIDPPKLVQPRNHKASVVIWSDLTVNNIDEINSAENAEQIKRVLADIFHLEDYTENQKTAILVDLYYYTIQFAKDNSFNKEQTSVIFSIIKKTHEVCIETPFGNVQHCFDYFKNLLLCHAVKRPPFSMAIFSAEEIRTITDYVLNTYFRHYKMYKYVFTPQVRLDLTLNYIGMPASPTPPPQEDEETNAEKTENETGQDKPPTTPDGSVSKDGEGETGESNEEKIDKPDEKAAAVSELKSIIQKELNEEIKKIKISIEDQIKQTEEVINAKLSSAEGGQKGSRGSAKGKRK